MFLMQIDKMHVDTNRFSPSFDFDSLRSMHCTFVSKSGSTLPLENFLLFCPPSQFFSLCTDCNSVVQRNNNTVCGSQATVFRHVFEWDDPTGSGYRVLSRASGTRELEIERRVFVLKLWHGFFLNFGYFTWLVCTRLIAYVYL